MIKQFATIVLCGALSASLPALADAPRHRYENHSGAEAYYDYAKVVDVDPIWRRDRRPGSQDCWVESTGHRRSSGGNADDEMIAGGLVGGVIGNRIAGDGRRTEGGIIGAATGAAIGYAVGKNDGRGRVQEDRYREVRCRDNHRDRARVEGYRVTYVYHGQTFTTRLPYDPGRKLRIQVQVHPAS